MSKNIDYEKINPETDKSLNTLVRLLARSVAKEQIENQKRINQENNPNRERKRK